MSTCLVYTGVEALPLSAEYTDAYVSVRVHVHARTDTYTHTHTYTNASKLAQICIRSGPKNYFKDYL